MTIPRLAEQLNLLKNGAGSVEIARQIALEDNISQKVVDEALFERAREMYKLYLTKIYQGHRGYEDAARELAKEHNLPLGELETALREMGFK